MLSVVRWTTISIHRRAFTAFLSLFCAQKALVLLMCAWTNRARTRFATPFASVPSIFDSFEFSNFRAQFYQWRAINSFRMKCSIAKHTLFSNLIVYNGHEWVSFSGSASLFQTLLVKWIVSYDWTFFFLSLLSKWMYPHFKEMENSK